MKHYLVMFLFIFICPLQKSFCEILSFNHCHLEVIKERKTSKENKSISLLFFNGIPLTSSIFLPLFEKLQERDFSLELTRINIPGTGNSDLTGNKEEKDLKNWQNIKTCLKDYLKTEDEFILVTHDISSLWILPLLKDASDILQKTKGLIIINSLLSTKNFKLSYPMSTLAIPYIGPVINKITTEKPYLYSLKQRGFSNPENVDKTFLKKLYQEAKTNKGKERSIKILKGLTPQEIEDQKIEWILNNTPSLPKIFLWGEKDNSLRKFAPNLGSSNNEKVMPKGKHFFVIDHAKEVARNIISFLQESF